MQVTAYAGRAGIQLYGPGDAVYDNRPDSLKDNINIRLLRPVGEVFNAESLKTYPLKPVTINHPPESVNSNNIKNYSTGVIVLSGLIRLAFSCVPIDRIESLFANLHSAIQKLRSK